MQPDIYLVCIPGTPFGFVILVNCVSLLLSFTIVPLGLLLDHYFHQAQPAAQQLHCHSDRQKTALLKYIFVPVCIFCFSLAKESKEKNKRTSPILTTISWSLTQFLLLTVLFLGYKHPELSSPSAWRTSEAMRKEETAAFRNLKTLNSEHKWDERVTKAVLCLEKIFQSKRLRLTKMLAESH